VFFLVPAHWGSPGQRAVKRLLSLLLSLSLLLLFCAQTRSFQLGVLIALLSLYDAYAAVRSTWIANVNMMCLLVHLQQ